MAVSVVSFSFSWCSTGGPGAHSAGWWLSLLHLISIFSGPQFNRGPQAPSAWCGFPYHISSITPSVLQLQLSWLLSWLSYIIIQHPLSRLLDLWNRMFDRHQAEITVMQFTGHSLSVHQSMSVPWEFFYLVPFRQPISAHAISSHNCHLNVSLPSGASPWNGIFGRVEGQNTTLAIISRYIVLFFLAYCLQIIDVFKNRHKFPIGFKSGDWLGHCKTLNVCKNLVQAMFER